MTFHAENLYNKITEIIYKIKLPEKDQVISQMFSGSEKISTTQKTKLRFIKYALQY